MLFQILQRVTILYEDSFKDLENSLNHVVSMDKVLIFMSIMGLEIFLNLLAESHLFMDLPISSIPKLL